MFAALAASSSLPVAFGAPRIVTPSNATLLKQPRLTVQVKAPPRSKFTAWVGTTDVTSAFQTRGSSRIATLGNSDVKRGTNYLVVQTEGASGAKRVDWTRFVVARPGASLLGVAPLKLNHKSAPLLVTATHPDGSHLRVNLNGRRVNSAFHQQIGDAEVAGLGADDGVRFGKNHIKVTAFDDRGSYEVESRHFRVGRDRPIAAAGRDRSVLAGTRVKLNARGSRLAGGGHPAFHWRLLQAPGVAKGSGASASAQPILTHTRSARPVLHTQIPGSYDLQVTVRKRGHGPRSHDTVEVSADPKDPPIGAPIQTIGARGAIVIAGQPVPDTGAPPKALSLSYALLDRSNRLPATTSCRSDVPRTGVVATSASGIQRLEKLVTDCSDTRFMLVASGTGGIDPAGAPELDKLLSAVGGAPLSQQDRAAVIDGSPFSFIGEPTAPRGSAFTNFGCTADQPDFSADCGKLSADDSLGGLSGYLQRNQATTQYGFVYSSYPGFSTHVSGTSTSNTMDIGGQTFEADFDSNVPPGTSGFHLVVMDPKSLENYSFIGPIPEDVNEMWATNTGDPAKDRTTVNELAHDLQEWRNETGLIFIQSVGHPHPTTGAWNGLADVMEKLGATRSVFLQLDGSGGYAFVGGTGVALPAEASEPLTHEPGILQGVLSRDRSSNFEPTLADPLAPIQSDLMRILYQPARPFPAFTGGQQNANQYIAKAVFGPNVDPVDIRAQYWVSWSDDWGSRQKEIAKVDFPGKSACGCNATNFTDVQRAVDPEITKVIQVKNWISNLRGTLDPTKTAFDLATIGKKIADAVQPPDVTTGDLGWKIIIGAMNVAGNLAPEGGGYIGAAATGLDFLSGIQSGSNGSPLLGEIQAKTSELTGRVLDRFEQSRAALVGMGLILVSDQGKLDAAVTRINDPKAWKFPASDTPLRTTINKGMKIWFYSELMPAAWITFNLPIVGNARNWDCLIGDPDAFDTRYPFKSEPDSGQYRTALSVNDQGQPSGYVRGLGIRSTFDHPKSVDDDSGRPPPASLTDPLFKPADLDPSSDRLGLYPQVFYERNFDRGWPPVDSGRFCDA